MPRFYTSYRGRSYRRNYRRSYGKSQYKKEERLAYNLGKISSGIKDPNTRVYDSFVAGCSAKKRISKPLY